MTDLENALAHHGVKGMKWGVRKDRGHEGQRASTRKIDRLDRKFKRKASRSSTYFKIYNYAAEKMNSIEIDRINNDPRFKDKDFTAPSKTRTAYYNEYSKTMTKHLNDAASDFGVSASGKRLKFEYDVESDSFPRWEIVDD